jgi:hypothetical protein
MCLIFHYEERLEYSSNFDFLYLLLSCSFLFALPLKLTLTYIESIKCFDKPLVEQVFTYILVHSN